MRYRYSFAPVKLQFCRSTGNSAGRKKKEVVTGAMKVCLLVFLLNVLQISNGEVDFRDYASADVKRFDDELRRLGVITPPMSYPEKPAKLLEPSVSSAAGDFEGYWTKSRFGRLIAAFEGIPYAKPAVGPLRFSVAEPGPVLSSFKAKKPGSPCIQRDAYLRNKIIKGNENCLFINIYVPEKTQWLEAELLPVIFYIHGGGFIAGRGDAFQSNILLDKDVVLVTVNYRMGPLGFLTTEDGVIPGNLGIKDQMAGLRWVHENIGAFGGNPNLITVMGHSAGAACAELLMLSPLTRGLINRVILMSGSSFDPWAMTPRSEIHHLVQRAATSLSCPEEPSSALLACLRNKTAEEIALVDFNFPEVWGKTPAMYFKPVVEGDVPGALLPRHPKDLYDTGLTNDVPVLAGFTSGEGVFATFGLFTNETLIREMDEDFVKNVPQALYLKLPHQKRPETIESLRRAYFSPGPLTKSNFFQAARLFTDVFFHWPITKSAIHHRKTAKSPAYLYYNSFENAQTILKLPPGCSRKKLGPSHGDDLFYLFNIPSELKPSPQDIYMSVIITDLFSSFAQNGVPSSNHLKADWHPLQKNSTYLNYLHIKSPVEISMELNLFPERQALLEKLLWAD